MADRLVRLGVGAKRASAAAAPLLDLAGILRDRAIPLGYIGPREANALLERHILESAALDPHLADGPWVDVGSGAGLPGLVLAALRPAVRGLLVEAETKRCRFLREVADELEMPWVEVANERAETLGRGAEREQAQTALARALAPPPVALEFLLPLVAVGGRAVLAAGPSANEALADSRAAATALGGGPPELVELEVPGLGAARWAMIVKKVTSCPERYPRRVGVPARRPLGRGRA